MDAATAPAAATLCYRVGGMDCPSCASKVETALNRLVGTDGVRLNYQTTLLALRLNEAITPRQTIEATVRALGFDIRPVEPVRVMASNAVTSAGEVARAAPAWWSAANPRLLVAISTLLLLGTFADWAVPGPRSWGAVPAALVGLGYFGRQALRLARTGSPFSIEMLMSIATLGAIMSVRRSRLRSLSCCSPPVRS